MYMLVYVDGCEREGEEPADHPAGEVQETFTSLVKVQAVQIHRRHQKIYTLHHFQLLPHLALHPQHHFRSRTSL